MSASNANPREFNAAGCPPRAERHARSMTTALDYANAAESSLGALSANRAETAATDADTTRRMTATLAAWTIGGAAIQAAVAVLWLLSR